MNGKVAKAIRKVLYKEGYHKDERAFKTRLWKFKRDSGKTDEKGETLFDIVLRYTIFNAPLTRRALYQRLKREYKDRFRRGEQRIYSKIIHSLKSPGRRISPVAQSPAAV
jgi:hypothetical protein